MDRCTKKKFLIGDVHNNSTLKSAMHSVNYIFHAEALKPISNCEFFPMKTIKTSVIGIDNILKAAINEGFKCVICLSIDKTAYPINVMVISKVLEEKKLVAKSRNSHDKRICCSRYENVMRSYGSVIPHCNP